MNRLLPTRALKLEQDTDLKRKAIARLCGGYHPKYLGQALRGEKEISDDLLQSLADIFNTTPEYLTGKSNIAKRKESA